MRRAGPWVAALAGLGLAAPGGAAQVTAPSTGGAAALARAEAMLGHTRRVLMIAAHPDDEDTELLTYLVRHEGAESAYLSLTRGEGGQNLLGPELGEALGLLRSEELLAARALDGARQYFTRAFDFGYSRHLDEALAFWPADSLLKDVVRIVRRFRPQVVVSVFSGTPRDGHGQHQAAGWAAREAFAAAGDPGRFPELEREEGLAPWAPLKLYRSARFDTTGTTLVLDGGILDAEVGQSYRQIAMRGRSLHRSQDMGALQEIGPSEIRLARLADRTGTPAGAPLFAGIDTSPPPPRSAGPEAADLARHAAVAGAIRAGLVPDAITAASRLVPGQELAAGLALWNAGPAPATVTFGLELAPGWTAEAECLGRPVPVAPGRVARCEARLLVPPDAPFTAPYFLRLPRAGALYRWDGPAAVRGEPFGPPPVRARFVLRPEGGEALVLEREVVQRLRDQAVGEVRRPLAVGPRVDVAVSPRAMVWPLGRAVESLTVSLRSAVPDTTTGTVHVEVPPGWPAVAGVPFELTRLDDRAVVVLPVRPPAGLAAGHVTLRVFARDRAGRRYDAALATVDYPHVRPRHHPVPAAVDVRVAALALPAARRIGYVRGAADRVPEALAGVGLPVEVLDAPALERADLARFDVIVIGSRAYETEPALAENNGRLLGWVRDGGRLVVQYQQHPFFQGDFAPYPLAVAARHDRVTDEGAPVRVLAPDLALFGRPNPIGPADWDGWVQERGLYFASAWDDRYRPLLELHDPGEPALRGGLLVARVGRGTWAYTGLSFFRQLPAGVPGAFRLFLNLLDFDLRAPQP